MVILAMNQVQSSAVMMRSNITRYFIQHCIEWSRISLSVKIHPISRPNELWSVFYEDSVGNWPRYNSTALCLQWISHCLRIVISYKDDMFLLQVASICIYPWNRRLHSPCLVQWQDGQRFAAERRHTCHQRPHPWLWSLFPHVRHHGPF